MAETVNAIFVLCAINAFCSFSRMQSDIVADDQQRATYIMCVDASLSEWSVACMFDTLFVLAFSSSWCQMEQFSLLLFSDTMIDMLAFARE